jgi:hypothetical protein
MFEIWISQDSSEILIFPIMVFAFLDFSFSKKDTRLFLEKTEKMGYLARVGAAGQSQCAPSDAAVMTHRAAHSFARCKKWSQRAEMLQKFTKRPKMSRAGKPKKTFAIFTSA